MTESQRECDVEESVMREFFSARYEHLLSVRRNVKTADWTLVIKEMLQSLNEYKSKTRDTSLECLRKCRDLPLSAKMSANCVSVVSATFCDKFRDLEVEIDISRITDELYDNITALLPYFSVGIFSLRMVEIMLYSMCTVCEWYIDDCSRWSILALTCFNHGRASREIKLASCVIICHIDKLGNVVTKDVYDYLLDTILDHQFVGFKKKDIEYSLTLISSHFKPKFQAKEVVTEPRDSGYKSEDGYSEGSQRSGEGRRKAKKKKQHDKDKQNHSSEIETNTPFSIWPILGGALAAMAAILIYTKFRRYVSTRW